MSAGMHKMRGIGLVELMISMTLGLATVGVIGWVYLGTVQTYRSHDALSRLQESGRYAFELISKDLRMAGATGCGYSDAASVASGTAWYTRLLTRPVQSVEQDDSAAAGATNEFSDALSVVRADVSREYIVDLHGAGSFTLKAPHDIQNGDLVVATDCSHAAAFHATGSSGSTVGHATGTSPGNFTDQLGMSGGGYAYTEGSRLYRVSANTYFVRNNAAGVPSLFRRRFVAGAEVDEELVEGVEDLQVTYAVDTSGTADGIADYVDPSPYLTADEVLDELTGTDDEKWARVVAVRVSLLLRSVEDNVVPAPQTISYNGEAPTAAADRRLRKVFTHVVKLRNR